MAQVIPTNGGMGSADAYLARNGWPSGLRKRFIEQLVRIPIRFIIVDDSGSMGAADGHRLVGDAASKSLVSCTRWAELGDSIRFLAGLAETAQAPTEFRLLNKGYPILVGRGEDDGQNVKQVVALLNESPDGMTPLCRHINQVVATIRGIVNNKPPLAFH